ncbi:MAG: hypothetical protein JSS81_01355 [Acidobacteria bacterium]|nr:hypothetical protein [Acidobacteriota bacterium]
MPESDLTKGVEIELCDGYLHITHPEGFIVSAEALEPLWANLADACRRHRCKKVLNEGRLDFSRLRTYDSYQSGSYAGEIRGLQMACLFYGFIPMDKAEFFKTVASNRGARIDFFEDRASALKWLGVGPAS